MIEHLIYDFDGTIADSYPLFVRFLRKGAKKRGYRIECSDEVLYRTAKITIYETYRTIGGEAVIPFQTFIDDFHELQVVHKDEFLIFPQAKKLLLDAKRAGKHNYIYTHTGPVVKEMLANMGVLDTFDFILDASYGFPMKPSPDALCFFLEKFGFDPRTCMMIGDRPIDAYAGMNAGMYGCLWDEDGLFPDAKVDYYLKDLLEVAQICGI